MPFQKGISGNYKGRKKGIPNKVTKDIREALHSFIEGNLSSIQATFDQLEPKDKIRYLIDLLPFILPKYQSTALQIQNDFLGVDKIFIETKDKEYPFPSDYE